METKLQMEGVSVTNGLNGEILGIDWLIFRDSMAKSVGTDRRFFRGDGKCYFSGPNFCAYVYIYKGTFGIKKERMKT